MKLRRTAIALATVASLVVIPTTAFANGQSDKFDKKDCKSDSQVVSCYAPKPECNKDWDERDHRDGDRDKKDQPKERQKSYSGRVLKTS